MELSCVLHVFQSMQKDLKRETNAIGTNESAFTSISKQKDSVGVEDHEKAVVCAMKAFAAKDNVLKLSGEMIKAIQRCVFGCKILPPDEDAVSKVLKEMKKKIERQVQSKEKVICKLKERGLDKQCEKLEKSIQALRNSNRWVKFCNPGNILRQMVDCCRSLTKPLSLNAEWQRKFQAYFENPTVDGKIPKPVDGGKYEQEFERILKQACKNTEFSAHTNVNMTNKLPKGCKAEFDVLIIRDSEVVAIIEVKASYVPLYHGVMNVYRGLFGSNQQYVWREKNGHKMLAVPSKREFREKTEFVKFGAKAHIVGVAFVRQKDQSQSMRDYAQASLVSRAFKEGTSLADLKRESGHEDLYSFPAELKGHAEARAEQCQHFWMKKQDFDGVEHAAGLDDSGGDVKKFLNNVLLMSGFEREPLEDAGASLLKSVNEAVVIRCAGQSLVKRATILSRLEAMYQSKGKERAK